MFPTIKVSVFGLDPHTKYHMLMDIAPLDDKRYKYAYHRYYHNIVNLAYHRYYQYHNIVKLKASDYLNINNSAIKAIGDRLEFMLMLRWFILFIIKL